MSAAGTTCARCGVPWTLDNRSTPCAMALDNTHLFAEGVTAPEVERLRRIERAARALVVDASIGGGEAIGCRTMFTIDSALIEALRAALEPA